MAPQELIEIRDSIQQQEEAGKKFCRFCNSTLTKPFLNLGSMPLANSYIKAEDLEKPESSYPLRVFFCPRCFLVQLVDMLDSTEIFKEDYAYFSSYSKDWLDWARQYTDMVVERFHLDLNDFVIEVASNDGYLLQYFQQRGIPLLGVEPSRNVAQAAIEKGIPTLMKFFGVKTALQLVQEGKKADLLVANNVFAHVPDVLDFVKGMKLILKPNGVITMEFPHLLNLIKEVQFDTIYHEHFSYYSLHAAQNILKSVGLVIFDVEEIPTHGGSLRIYAGHTGKRTHRRSVSDLLEKEKKFGLTKIDLYLRFTKKVEQIKGQLLHFLEKCKSEGKKVAGYGAPAKGNTLLNYCGINEDLLPWTVDISPHKRGTYLPGSRIPVRSVDVIRSEKPDYLLILPWNIKNEIMKQMSFVGDWSCKFVTAVPEIRIMEPV